MHHCLRISEIISLVAVEVVGPRIETENPRMLSQDKEGLRSLAAMARTCRTFYDPAMNSLWLFLYSMDHLLALLPELPDGDALTATWHERLKLFVPRFRSIATRVKRVTLELSTCVMLNESLDILRRAACSPTGLLLPNLSCLYVASVSAPDGLEGEAMRYVSDILYGPGIQDLRIYSPSAVVQTHLDLSLFQNLRTFLSSSPLPTASLVYLAKLTSLQKLSIILPTPTDADSLQEKSSFLSLRDLRLVHMPIQNNLPRIAPFLKKLVPHLLHTLSADCFSMIPDMAESNTTIRAVSAFVNLRQLDLSLHSTEHIQGCDLRPLQSLHLLQSLKLNLMGIGATVANRDLAEFGAAWPDLTSFTLQHRSIFGMLYGQDRISGWWPNHLTVAALAGFAEHFPRLEHLDVDVDVCAEDRPAAADVPRSAHPHIRTLELFSCVPGPGDAASMAAYVSAVCPGAWLNRNALHVYGLTPEAQAPQVWWEDVRDMVNEWARPNWCPPLPPRLHIY